MSVLLVPDHRATIAERVAFQIGEKIFTGVYPPGSALREGDLTAQYDVSRHVIREVLRTLAADGLVDYASFRGARVPMLSAADGRDIYRARRAVECGAEAMGVMPNPKLIRDLHRQFAAAAKAGDWPLAFNLDIAFHAAILDAVGSPRMSAWLASLQKDLRLAHLVAPSFNKQAFVGSVDEHEAIVAAIAEGDVKRARAAMKRHLDAAEEALIAGMERRQA